MSTTSNNRQSEYAIDPLFLDRWSPRAFTGEIISEAELLTLLDAAHWAPSAFNGQPWRFVYALKGSESWDRLFGLLNDFNQGWAHSASAIVIILSKTHSQPKPDAEPVPNYSHSFDTGAAWGSFALQAKISGFQAHGMTGVHFDKVAETLGVPDGFRVEAAAVIGRIGDKSILPGYLQERETPSPRLPVSQIAFEGKFKA